MLTILYTDSDAVRSVLGVESFSDQALQREIPDTYFSTSGMVRQLRSDLYSWVPDHATIVTDGDDVGATAEEVQKADLIRNYSLYFVAARAARMAYATRRIVADGKSEQQRFEIDWMKLAEGMEAQAEAEQKKLQDIIDPSEATTFMWRAVPDYDPVANT